MWLRHRLEVAIRGADLLEHKLRALHAQRQRLDLRQRRSGAEWADRLQAAETWLLRAVLVGGQRSVRPTAGAELAEVTVGWAAIMGVRYPDITRCQVPAQPWLPTLGSAALGPAREAYVLAVEAAARHAAAQRAVRLVDIETASTQQRVLALRHRWIPQLEEALARIEFGLEESERSESSRRLWTASGDRQTEPD